MLLKIKKILKKRRVQLTLQLAFTLLLLILILNSINVPNLIQSLSSINIRLLLLSLLITLVIRFIWAYQISIIQAPLNMHFSVYEIFKIQMIATFYTLFLPGNLVAGGVSWYKLTTQPAEDIINQALGERDISVRGHAGWLKSCMSEFIDQRYQRNSILQRHRSTGSDYVHKSSDGGSFFCHGDKQFARLTVIVQADR